MFFNQRSTYSTVPTLVLTAGLSWLAVSPARGDTVIQIAEDVMTSGFFQGDDRVRGYDGDGRAVHRVSTVMPFGSGDETVYITFGAGDITALGGEVTKALLTVQSVSGGFGADAGAGNPFSISAHAVDADPLTSIIDDTNPGGTIAWQDFLANNVLDANPAAITSVDGFGAIEFDVTQIVNRWLDGTNTVFAIALTGKNDTSGNDFLHGIANNSDAPGSTFLSVVPEPSSTAALAAGGVVFVLQRRRRSRPTHEPEHPTG